jgi:hypothetical protein
MKDFKTLNIWRNAFEDGDHSGEEERLSAALNKVRTNAEALGQKIAHDFPNLTIHDVTHMDALWRVADLLVGKAHKLNPLEVFVLGCTFYLHDAALCFDAYAGGTASVRETDVWKDAFWRHQHGGQEEGVAQEAADFDAIRALHARQAEEIAHNGWSPNGDDRVVFVIEDEELREHHGPLIGKIAASHHWDIQRVATDLQDIQNPVASLPNEWTIRPILLACILRCADAAQIDGTRAPEQLIRFMKAGGVSRDHWNAQNRIGAISKSGDASKLLITTTKPFKKEDSSAWWVAYDTVQMIERELKGANLLLRRKYEDQAAFLVDGVDSNFSPADLASRIQTEGWEPTNATVKVGDVERVVGSLGGHQLYGSDDILAVVARELIQNALDAISARKAVDLAFDAGIEVSVELVKYAETGNWVLRVADKGVGMSSSVLLNSLLDFGNSFWTSPKASEEFPGLQSKNAQIIGRFGIGFFSVFAVAQSVNVYSRRFDGGHNDFRCLEFPRGLTLRPIHSSAEPEASLRGFSTIVEVEISPTEYSGDGSFEVKVGHQGQTNFDVSFTEFVSSMICDVRAKIQIRVEGEDPLILEPAEFNLDKARADLKRFSFEKPSEQAQQLIDIYAERMRVLSDGNRTFGFAALVAHNVQGAHFVSSKTIDGLSTPHNRGTDGFVGWLEHECRSAKRDTGELQVPQDVLSNWLEEQADIFLTTNPDPLLRYIAAANFAQLKGDPKKVLGPLVVFHQSAHQVGFIDQKEIAGVAAAGNLLIPVSDHGNWIDRYCKISVQPNDFVLFPYLPGGAFSDVEIQDGQPSKENSLAAAITDILKQQGQASRWVRLPKPFESAFGHADALRLEIVDS